MGTLIAKAYPTILMAKAADHTYVECGTGMKGWSCWGGQTGGRVLNGAAGSTKRADAIAEPNERGGITCYLVNGVCHQAANRILHPAAITVKAAKGYWLSSMLFNTYGRVGFWKCKAPINWHSGVSGDLSECAAPAADETDEALSEDRARERKYLQEVARIYDTERKMLSAESVPQNDVWRFHQKLFMHTAEFKLGSGLSRELSETIRGVFDNTESARLKLETLLAANEMKFREYVDAFNDETIMFQNRMAENMTEKEYESLFELVRGETIVLADPQIVKEVDAR